MNLLIRIALVALMAAVAGGVRTGAQAPNNAQAQRNQLANQPAPRTSDGRIVHRQHGDTQGCLDRRQSRLLQRQHRGGAGVFESVALPGRVAQVRAVRALPRERASSRGRGRGAAGPCTQVPYMPWTLAVSNDRRLNELEPHTRCKPSGGPRQWLTPYGAEFLEMREERVAYIFDIGGPHTYRTIYLDGRKHPETLTPSFYGHSIGWWEGDMLVVDTVGFNEGFWLDRGQLPHTDKLHLIERYTRTALDTMKYELTIDDPGAYTTPFTATSNLRWENGTELFEYVCQQMNQAHELMVGAGTSVDRSTLIVP